MNDHLDAWFERLRQQPTPPRLDRLEVDVAQSLRQAAPAQLRSWRFAATGVALALGLGVGTSAAALRNQPSLAADLTAGVRLAPSSLLDTSR
jgi:hypothetical protein